MAGAFYTPPRPGLPPLTETRTSISKFTINFGGASITACVTGSTRVLDDLLRDEGTQFAFLQGDRLFSDCQVRMSI